MCFQSWDKECLQLCGIVKVLECEKIYIYFWYCLSSTFLRNYFHTAVQIRASTVCTCSLRWHFFILLNNFEKLQFSKGFFSNLQGKTYLLEDEDLTIYILHTVIIPSNKHQIYSFEITFLFSLQSCKQFWPIIVVWDFSFVHFIVR